MNLCFVYGTLKRRGGNHFLIAHGGADNRFLGAGQTKEKLPMLSQGIPYVFNLPGQGHHVRGEAYEINDRTLRHLDQLEGHPVWYRRIETDIVLDDAKEVRAWLYFCQTREGMDLVRRAIKFAPHLLKAEF